MTALTRRSLLGTTGAAAATIGLGDLALAGPAGYDSIPAWIDRSARPLMHLDSAGPDLDLHPLRRIVGSARMVGLGESSHTTDSLFVLKHRVARFLVERMGFRTVAWEETWGSGALIDRYVTGRGGDPRDIAAQASYNLQHLALLDLIEWMRDFNRGRPAGDQVRFLGADVTQLRGVQFTELTTYVDDVAPEQSERLATHLRPLQIQGDPGSHIGWYLGLDQAEQEVLVEQARAVERLVRGLPRGQSSVSRRDAEMHAFALLGFYHANTHEGGRQDLRDRYIADILDRWLRMSARPVVYSAANAHTVAAPRQIVSFPDPWSPPDQWVTERSLAGGLLRERYGADYVSIGTTFDHGTILSGWQTGEVRKYDVPPPAPDFIDHVLGGALLRNYLLDLRQPAPETVRRWLRRRGSMRIYGGAYYDPTLDSHYFHALDRWGMGFDALLHLREVSAARPL